MKKTAQRQRAALSTDNFSNLDPLVLSDPARPAQASIDELPKRRKVALAEPVTVARFWKNRRHDAIVVTLSTFEGRNIVDVRQHFMNQAGQLQASPKGVAMVVLRLPDLAAAITKALAKARDLGLLEASS
jgi:hypothetical protein